ncbi:class I SAM-dependent methyltransferase [Kozakia baliensis]|uniref:hypothetical protein n=1 Tax=Kozakia baliensis TaxID=153496 RepID=UPI000497F3F0|nr:hypothetical protein [Kozakia baliensis]
MRLNSRHSYADRGNDFYPTPREAIEALIKCERGLIPKNIWEPACGDGAIVRPLREAGYNVVATDLIDYGAGFQGERDFLLEELPHREIQGIITNPPFKLAMPFVEKAIKDVPYSAWLLRINFLESIRRLPFFRKTPPARIWVSSRRLPTMHRHGWEGPKASSNMFFAWFVFERGSDATALDWFDWEELCENAEVTG